MPEQCLYGKQFLQYVPCSRPQTETGYCSEHNTPKLECAVIEAAIEWRSPQVSETQGVRRLQALWDATNALIAAREK